MASEPAAIPPFTEQQVAFRKDTAIDMLGAWRADKPVSRLRSDIKTAKIDEFTTELRYIATIDALRERERKLREYAECKDSCASNTCTQCDGSIRLGYSHSAHDHDFQPHGCDCGLAELLAAKELPIQAVEPNAKQERCASHVCLRRQSDDPCTNYKHGKSRGLCATCFNSGCPATESVLLREKGAV